MPEDKSRELYARLGVAPGATEDEIRDAYYELAKSFHPDQQRGDEKADEVFRNIVHAATILRDPEKRRLYDRGDIDARGGFQRLTDKRARRSDNYALVACVVFVIIFMGGSLAAVLLKQTATVHLAKNEAVHPITSTVSPQLTATHDLNNNNDEEQTTASLAQTKLAIASKSAAPKSFRIDQFPKVLDGGLTSSSSAEEKESVSGDPSSALPTHQSANNPTDETDLQYTQRQTEKTPSKLASADQKVSRNKSIGKDKALSANLSLLPKGKESAADCPIAVAARRMLVRFISCRHDSARKAQ